MFHGLLLVSGVYPLIIFDKVAFFLQLNRLHHPFFDHFFYYITFLGSSATYALFMVILVVIQLENRVLLAGVCSFVAMSTIVQGMKRIIFADQLRPTALIPTDVPYHLVEGIIPDTHFSFPSGHSATIFAAICLIHFLMPKKPTWFSILVFLVAVIVAYSRVYLCQHFYEDIYVGAWIGTGATTVVYGVLVGWQGPSWLDQKPLASLVLLLKNKSR